MCQHVPFHSLKKHLCGVAFYPPLVQVLGARLQKPPCYSHPIVPVLRQPSCWLSSSLRPRGRALRTRATCRTTARRRSCPRACFRSASLSSSRAVCHTGLEPRTRRLRARPQPVCHSAPVHPDSAATHTFEPCLGQPCRCARTRTSRRAAPKARTPDSQAGSQAGLGLLLTRVRLALHRRGSEAAYRSELLFRRASEARSTLIAVMKAAAPSEEGGDEDEGEAVCHTGLEPRTSRR